MRGFFLAPPGVAVPGASLHTARQHNPCLATQGQIIVFPAIFCQPSSLLALALRNSPQYQHERTPPVRREGSLRRWSMGQSLSASRASCHTRGRSESPAGLALRTWGRSRPWRELSARGWLPPVREQAPAALRGSEAARARRAPPATLNRARQAPRVQAGTAALVRGPREAAQW